MDLPLTQAQWAALAPYFPGLITKTQLYNLTMRMCEGRNSQNLTLHEQIILNNLIMGFLSILAEWEELTLTD